MSYCSSRNSPRNPTEVLDAYLDQQCKGTSQVNRGFTRKLGCKQRSCGKNRPAHRQTGLSHASPYKGTQQTPPDAQPSSSKHKTTVYPTGSIINVTKLLLVSLAQSRKVPTLQIQGLDQNTFSPSSWLLPLSHVFPSLQGAPITIAEHQPVVRVATRGCTTFPRPASRRLSAPAQQVLITLPSTPQV